MTTNFTHFVLTRDAEPFNKVFNIRHRADTKSADVLGRAAVVAGIKKTRKLVDTDYGSKSLSYIPVTQEQLDRLLDDAEMTMIALTHSVLPKVLAYVAIADFNKEWADAWAPYGNRCSKSDYRWILSKSSEALAAKLVKVEEDDKTKKTIVKDTVAVGDYVWLSNDYSYTHTCAVITSVSKGGSAYKCEQVLPVGHTDEYHALSAKQEYGSFTVTKATHPHVLWVTTGRTYSKRVTKNTRLLSGPQWKTSWDHGR